jgi:hypothetical protein
MYAWLAPVAWLDTLGRLLGFFKILGRVSGSLESYLRFDGDETEEFSDILEMFFERLKG